jgi:hypothetical protein
MFVFVVVESGWNEKQIATLSDQHQGPFCFATMGDNRGNIKEFPEIISQLNNQYAFAINNGDTVNHGYIWQYIPFHQQIKKSAIPYMVVIGNHELNSPFGGGWFNLLYGDHNYTFVYGNTKFIAINNNPITDETFIWLEKELDNDFDNNIIIMHQPAYDPRYDDWNDDGWYGMKERGVKLMNLLEENNVQMVIAGHLHGYEEDKQNGIQYIITGGAGAKLKDGAFYHYTKVCVNGNEINWEVIRI